MVHCSPSKYTIEINKLKDAKNNEEPLNLGTIIPSSLTNYLEEQSYDYPHEIIYVLNSTLRQYVSKGDIELGKIIIPLVCQSKVDLPGNIIQTEGFLRSFRPTQQGLALNIDLAKKFFHKTINVLEYLKTILYYKGDNFQNMKELLDQNMLVLD